MVITDGLTHSDGDTKNLTVGHPRGRLQRRRHRAFLLLAGAAAATLAAAACGSSSKTSSGTTATSPPAAAAPAANSTATSAAPATSAPSGTQVTATLTEFHIMLSQQTLTPGSYTFKAVNAGHTTHALAITGPGLSSAATPSLQPGQTATLSVTLQAGTYNIFCPVDGHKALGMNLNLTVGASSTSSPAPAPTAPPTTKASGGSSSWAAGPLHS